MRLWTVDPKYLDCKGLVACWREALLAKEVLKGNTEGWKKHPQLDRFKFHPNPVGAIETYLRYIWKESKNRNYNFDRNKIGSKFAKKKIKVSRSFVDEEFKTLKKKLKDRSSEDYKEVKDIEKPDLAPIFTCKN